MLDEELFINTITSCLCVEALSVSASAKWVTRSLSPTNLNCYRLPLKTLFHLISRVTRRKVQALCSCASLFLWLPTLIEWSCLFSGYAIVVWRYRRLAKQVWEDNSSVLFSPQLSHPHPRRLPGCSGLAASCEEHTCVSQFHGSKDPHLESTSALKATWLLFHPPGTTKMSLSLDALLNPIFSPRAVLSVPILAQPLSWNTGLIKSCVNPSFLIITSLGAIWPF